MEPKKHTEKPWGFEDLLLDVDGYGFKRLVIRPGKMSSYHYHNAKNEIFYVSKGQAKIRLKEEEKILNVGNNTWNNSSKRWIKRNPWKKY